MSRGWQIGQKIGGYVPSLHAQGVLQLVVDNIVVRSLTVDAMSASESEPLSVPAVLTWSGTIKKGAVVKLVWVPTFLTPTLLTTEWSSAPAWPAWDTKTPYYGAKGPDAYAPYDPVISVLGVAK